MSALLLHKGALLLAPRTTFAVFTALSIVSLAMLANAQPPTPPVQGGPVIYSISPDRAGAGEQVTITGRGFAASNIVHFGGKSIPDVAFAGAIGITCTLSNSNCHPGVNQFLHVNVPPDATSGSAEVSVANANGASNVVPFTVLGTPAPAPAR
jgi:hypothetical protein